MPRAKRPGKAAEPGPEKSGAGGGLPFSFVVAAPAERRLAVLREEIEKDPEHLGYADLGQDYEVIAAQINGHSMIPNPAPRVDLPKRFGLLDLFAAVSPAEALKVYEYPALVGHLERVLAENDRPGMAALLAVVGSLLTEKSRAALAVMLAETEPDPAWPATVPGASRGETLGLGIVTPALVQEAMG
jgi:hypothetical protein